MLAVSCALAVACVGAAGENVRRKRRTAAPPVETEAQLQKVLAGFRSFRAKNLPARVFKQDGYARSHRHLKAYELTQDDLDKPLIGHRPVRDFVSLEYRWLGHKRYAPVAPEGNYRYALWDTRLLRKFLLIRRSLLARGLHPERLRVFSVHRTPRVNTFLRSTNVNTSKKSYHMRGQAIDLIHADLNDDGQIDMADQRLLIDTVVQIERKYPKLRGGLGVYINNIHTDTRQRCAFWCGKGETAGAACPHYKHRCRK